MMIMDVLPIGFFFHSYDFVKADIKREVVTEKNRDDEAENPIPAVCHDATKCFDMSLNPHRFL